MYLFSRKLRRNRCVGVGVSVPRKESDVSRCQFSNITDNTEYRKLATVLYVSHIASYIM